MKTAKDKYIDKLTRDLKEWSATIDEFEDIVTRASTDFQDDFQKSIWNLKEKRDLLSIKLLELRKSDSSKSLEKDVETAKHELKEAFDSARKTLKNAA